MRYKSLIVKSGNMIYGNKLTVTLCLKQRRNNGERMDVQDFEPAQGIKSGQRAVEV